MIHAGGGAKAGGGRKQRVCREQRGIKVQKNLETYSQLQNSVSNVPPRARTDRSGGGLCRWGLQTDVIWSCPLQEGALTVHGESGARPWVEAQPADLAPSAP